MTPRTLHLHPSDTVEVAIDAIPAGHKWAVAAMPTGAPVLKFGR